VLEAQRRDYKRALAAHNRLSEKLESALHQNHTASSACADATAAADAHARENKALKQQVADLSRQVRNPCEISLRMIANGLFYEQLSLIFTSGIPV
jgi:ABC-type uncharacterized transport system fused permease/ATPase subunit